MKRLLAITQIATRRDQAAEHRVQVLHRRGIWGKGAGRCEFQLGLPIGAYLANEISRLNVDRTQLRIPPEDLDDTPPDLT